MTGVQTCALPIFEELAARAGGPATLGGQFSVPVSTALNMLVLSSGKRNNVELHDMAAFLPGLRENALLELGSDISNWSFEGPHDAEQQFDSIFYNSRDAVGPRIARLLECYSSAPTRLLRFFSPSDVEQLSDHDFEQARSNRTPRFTIDAHDLARQVQAVCGSPLFTAKVAHLP